MDGNIMQYLFLGVFGIPFVICIVRILLDKCAPVKTVRAVVVHKQTVETFSKYSGNGTHKKYSVTFQTEKKRLSFYVSSFSYLGYKENETGILKYKGRKIIDFS